MEQGRIIWESCSDIPVFGFMRVIYKTGITPFHNIGEAGNE